MLQIHEINIKNNLYPKKALIYFDSETTPKASLLYFHGGGLLYGDKTDLPEYHVNRITKAGYVLFSFDYPLAPAAKLPAIFEDVCSSVNYYIKNSKQHGLPSLPYFLWGRSAGAYLCLLAAAYGKLISPPKGILSYYGYGFLCDNWFNTPSKFYSSFPLIDSSCLTKIPDKIHAVGELSTHYGIYVYARQSGYWKDLIYDGREKFFFLDYSLRNCKELPCPLFCAHSTGDTDVPYEEFLELSQKYKATPYIAASNEHDFDRKTDTALTSSLLDSSVEFLCKYLK